MQSSTLLVHKAGDRGVRDGGRWVNLSPNVHFDTKDIKVAEKIVFVLRVLALTTIPESFLVTTPYRSKREKEKKKKYKKRKHQFGRSVAVTSEIYFLESQLPSSSDLLLESSSLARMYLSFGGPVLSRK